MSLEWRIGDRMSLDLEIDKFGGWNGGGIGDGGWEGLILLNRVQKMFKNKKLYIHINQTYIIGCDSLWLLSAKLRRI